MLVTLHSTFGYWGVSLAMGRLCLILPLTWGDIFRLPSARHALLRRLELARICDLASPSGFQAQLAVQ